jgi:hypothetical protein
MTLTVAHRSQPSQGPQQPQQPRTPGHGPLEHFRALNQARVPSTDPRRLAMAGQLFPAARPGARLDDDRAAMRLLTAVIATP